MQGGTTYYFVDGIESALAQAQAVAGEGDISIAGGGQIMQLMLRAGAIERLQVHVAPLLLGGGVPLFDNGAPYAPGMVVREIVALPHVAHFVLERAYAGVEVKSRVDIPLSSGSMCTLDLRPQPTGALHERQRKRSSAHICRP